MGQLFIVLATIIVMLVIAERNAKNNKRIFSVIKNGIKEINQAYIQLFKEKSVGSSIVQGTLIILVEIFIAIAISTGVIKNINILENNSMNLTIKIFIIIASLLVIHFIIGYVLLSIGKLHKFVKGMEDKNVKVDLLLSYFILSIYFTVLIVFPEAFKEVYVLGLIGVFICYCLNMNVLLRLIMNPHKIKGENDNNATFSRIIIAALIVVVLIVLNLFLATCFVNSATPSGAYTNVASNFDLFYYTIITFTTVGYGDIAPVTMLAKSLSVVISLTNVICVTIFISSILSFRDKFNKE